MRKFGRFLILASIAIMAAACGSIKDIAVTSCKLASISPNGLKSVDAVLDIGIHNPTIAFTLSDVTGKVHDEDNVVVTFGGGPISIDKKSDNVYQLPCSATIGSEVSLFRILNLLKNKDFEHYKIDIEGDVILSGKVKKHLRIKDIPVTTLMEKAGIGTKL